MPDAGDSVAATVEGASSSGIGAPGATGTAQSPHSESATNQSGARHIPHYIDQHEEYIPVNRPLLLELSTFSALQEGAGAAGMFFFSGAFWLFATMLFEHSSDLKDYAPWFLACGLSMLFGIILIWVGYRHFKLKQERISEIFRANPSSIP